MIDKAQRDNNIIPRQIDRSVRLDHHDREVIDIVRAGEKSNREERKQKFDLAAFTLRMRTKLSLQYRGAELEERLQKCLDRALNPYRDIVKVVEPHLPKLSDRKIAKQNMRSRRR